MLLFSAAALASVYTAEDLVAAQARGLSAETTALMAESVGGGHATAVYLLRRGVSPEVVRGWGYPVAEAEGITAMRLGALEAPAEAPHLRVDTSALGRAMVEARLAGAPPMDAYRADLTRTGRSSAVFGTVFAVGGAFALAYGASGPCCAAEQIGGMHGPVVFPGEPNPILMGVGALGLLAGGVTLQFGARQLEQAGADRGAWLDPNVVY